MSSLRDFHVRALAAVFHDPPWKAWVVTKRLEPDIGYRRSGSTLDILRDSVEERLGIQGMIKLPNPKEYKSHELHGLLLLEAIKAYAERQGLVEAASVLSDARKVLTSGYAGPCDHLASYIDRVMTYNVEVALDAIHDRDPNRYSTRDTRYTNPFNPRKRLEQGLGKLQLSRIVEYIDVAVRSIVGLAEKLIKDGGLEPGAALLHSSLLVLEEAWWSVMGFIPPLADTRTPHHTIFDHLYATVAACGMITPKGEPAGRVVVVDLAGVQAWISETRRLRDLWAASWMASMLAWRSVEPLVEQLGPGVMVSPTTRLNPFYLSWLASKAGVSDIESACGKSGDKWLETLCSSLSIMPKRWPVDPIMPTRIHLIIPPGIEDVESRVKEAYRRAWESILEGIRYYLEIYYKHIPMQEEASESVDKHAWNYLKGIAEELQAGKLNLEVEPPLPLRLVDVSLNILTQTREYSDYNIFLQDEILNELKKQKDIESREANAIMSSLRRGVGGRWDEKLIGLYPYLMLVEIPKREARSRIKLTRRSGRHTLEHTRQLYTIYKRIGKTDWKPTCMTCGRMPAIIVGGAIKGIGRSNNDLENLLQEIRDERLCIYCLSKRLLRRLLTDKGYAKRLVHIPLSEQARDALVSGSTDHYTTVTQMNMETVYNTLTDILDKLEDDKKSIYTDLLSVLVYARVGVLPTTIPLTIFSEFSDRSQQVSQQVRRGRLSLETLIGKLLDSIKDKYKWVEKDKELIANALESVFIEALNDEAYRRALLVDNRFKGNKILTGVARAIDDMQEFRRYSRMYGVLVADGDFMGSGILQGRLRIADECSRRDDIEEYYDALLGNVGFENQMFKAKVRAATIAYVRALNTAIRRALEGSGVLEPGEWSDIVVPPSLSYHYTVSRALALSSVKDRMLVEELGGFLIYAGGDDLLAIIPPMRLLDDGKIEASGISLLYKSRLNYWGLISVDQASGVVEGFHKVSLSDDGPRSGRVTQIIAPAIQTYGRSTILYLAHVKTPMWHVISTAHRLMDEIKDAYSVKLVDGRVIGRKDVGIVYNERGTYGILPLTDKTGLGVAELAKTVERIFLKMEKGEKDAPSTSSLYRATDRREAAVLAELAKRDVQAAIRYLDSLMEPMGRVEGWSIVNIFGREALEKSFMTINRLEEELALPSRGIPEDSPVTVEVLEAVKALRSGVRRSA
ncbi:MAG: hypothetical protein GSR86_04940 [Desulfurococcales archaeon]|nr:hypothetical protein [Desulfurococcales archaeon]